MADKKENKISSKKIFLIGLGLIIAVVLLYFSAFLKLEKISIPKEANKASHEDRNAQALKEINKKAISFADKTSLRPVRQIDKTDYIQGDIFAPVQLIVYNDFSCPFCLQFQATIKKIKDYFGNKVVIALRYYPLRSHPQAWPAAEAAECAGAQEKFWPMSKKLFADNKAGRMEIKQYEKDAADLGLKKIEFNKCLEQNQYQKKIQSQWLEGRNFGVLGTPGLFVNGRPLAGAVPFENFTDSSGRQRQGMKLIIENALKK